MLHGQRDGPNQEQERHFRRHRPRWIYPLFRRVPRSLAVGSGRSLSARATVSNEAVPMTSCGQHVCVYKLHEAAIEADLEQPAFE
jgi:hypothetical protein